MLFWSSSQSWLAARLKLNVPLPLPPLELYSKNLSITLYSLSGVHERAEDGEQEADEGEERYLLLEENLVQHGSLEGDGVARDDVPERDSGVCARKTTI